MLCRFLFLYGSVCVAVRDWPHRWLYENCYEEYIINASRIQKPAERQLESSQKRPWEKIMFFLFPSLDFYMVRIAFCVWLIGVCVASVAFVHVDVFTIVPVYFLWQKIWFCAILCVCVCRAPRFKGYQQQDSQELLHYLLDSVRVEETKVSVCLESLFLKCSDTNWKNTETLFGGLTSVV